MTKLSARTEILTFPSKAEAMDWLAMSWYEALPVPQSPVFRLVAEKWDDDGVRYTSFASAAGTLPDGRFNVEIVDYGRTV